jgi:E3 ubiquitin-protein ligase HUWE1
VSKVLTFTQFLEGLFQHPGHCKDFMTMTSGLTRIGTITSLPCLPYDYANSVASDSIVQVMRTMTEVATSEALQQLAKLLQDSLKETEDYWKVPSSESKLLSLVDISGGLSPSKMVTSLTFSVLRSRRS